jgi:hypothetical protein
MFPEHGNTPYVTHLVWHIHKYKCCRILKTKLRPRTVNFIESTLKLEKGVTILLTI